MDDLPSGYVKIAIENGPVEIVDFPINSMVIFHCYVNVYQRVPMSIGDSSHKHVGPNCVYDQLFSRNGI